MASITRLVGAELFSSSTLAEYNSTFVLIPVIPFPFFSAAIIPATAEP